MERITQAEYWREIEAIAREAADDVVEGYDLVDWVHERIDNHEWMIYNSYHPQIMDYTDNEDEALELGKPDCDNWRDVVAHFAFWAMRADVLARFTHNDETDAYELTAA